MQDTTVLEAIEATYAPKIKAMLDEVRTEALERGFQCDEPFDMTDAEVRWCVLVRPAGSDPGDDVGVDVSITILESEECDGSEGGCNFGLDLVEYGGIVVGGMVPFNYTEQVWVPREDTDAVRSRWTIFDDGFSASAVVDRIENFYRERE